MRDMLAKEMQTRQTTKESAAENDRVAFTLHANLLSQHTPLLAVTNGEFL